MLLRQQSIVEVSKRARYANQSTKARVAVCNKEGAS